MNNRINFTDANLLNTKLSDFNKQLDNLYRLIELDGQIIGAKHPTTHLPKQTMSILSSISNVRIKIKAITIKLHSRDKLSKIQPKLNGLIDKTNKLMTAIDIYTNTINDLTPDNAHTAAYQQVLLSLVRTTKIAFDKL